MNFFDNFVLPQSAEHIQLINYLLIVLFALFIPYIGVLFVSSLLSIIYRGKGHREGNPVYLEFAAVIVRMTTFNKSIGVILGILPFLVITFMISQIMHGTNTIVLQFLFISFFLGSLGVVLIYTFRYSQDMEVIYTRLKTKLNSQDIEEDFENSSKGSSRLAGKSGLWGVLILAAGLWFLLSAVTVVMNPSLWSTDSIFVLFSWRVMLYALQFIAISAALTGASVLFSFFYWENRLTVNDTPYAVFLKNLGLHLTFWSALAIPLLMLFMLLTINQGYLSGSIFTFSVISLVLLLIAYNLIYAIVKTNNLKLSGPVFFLILFSVFSIIIKDHSALSNATKQQSVILDGQYQKYLAGLTGNREAEKISGKDIYTARCSPCHKFDQKVVGPAYNDVLPKYEGKQDELVKFVLNPVKRNPAFPPMPNPGLKPNEAKAVADYLLKTYQKK